MEINYLDNLPHLVPGSAPWILQRKDWYCASDAATAMRQGKYKDYDELLREKASGIFQETSGFQQMLYDDGHECEDRARPIIERKFNVELFVEVCRIRVNGLGLMASLDGGDLMRTVIWEHKLWNKELIAMIAAGDWPKHIWPQLEQQQLCTGIERTIFTVSDGTESNCESFEYIGRPTRKERLVAAWQEFDEDLKNYKLKKPESVYIAKRAVEIISPQVRVAGHIVSTNLSTFQAQAEERIESFNRDLQSDEDFVQADADVKECERVEKAIDACVSGITSQVASIDEAMRILAHWKNRFAHVRISLSKEVTAQKIQRETDIVLRYRSLLDQLISDKEESGMCGWAKIRLEGKDTAFQKAVHGLKTIKSVENACQKVLSDLGFEITKQAQLLKARCHEFEQICPPKYRLLFADSMDLIHSGHFAEVVESRIRKHEEELAAAAEQERLAAQPKQDTLFDRTMAGRPMDDGLPSASAENVPRGTLQNEGDGMDSGLRPHLFLPDERAIEAVPRPQALIRSEEIEAFLAVIAYRGKKVAQARAILEDFKNWWNQKCSE